jgi:hypothetical protein
MAVDYHHADLSFRRSDKGGKPIHLTGSSHANEVNVMVNVVASAQVESSKPRVIFV